LIPKLEQARRSLEGGSVVGDDVKFELEIELKNKH